MKKNFTRQDIKKDVVKLIGSERGGKAKLCKKLDIDKSVLSRFLKDGFGLDTIANKLGYKKISAFEKEK